MSRYRRPPRRQGVVYGPPLGRDPQPPTIAGRLLGAAVVVGALALMAVATLTFLGRGQPAPVASPTPTAAAVASPSPLTPTIAPTPTPLPPTPAPTPTLTPEPSPTPFVIEVVEGPGAVTFGTAVDEELRITDPTVNLPNRGRFAWSAELIEPAGDEELTVEVARFDPQTGEEDVIASNDNEFDDDAIRILRRGRVSRVFDGPGIYVVRYLRDEALLAEGYVQIAD